MDLLNGIAPLMPPWEYNVTSPPTIVGDVVVGSAVADMLRRIQSLEAVRASGAHTGAQVWRFDTVPRAGEPGAETWQGGSRCDAGGASM